MIVMVGSKVKAATGETVRLLSCWSCNGPTEARAAFCGTCSVVQPPRALDHFARLNLEQRFDLDPAQLDRHYFAAQRDLHPDRFAAKSPRERALSLQHATVLNEAYECLKQPMRRAAYLLELQGQALSDADGATISDPELLMEAMEMREELGAANTAAAVDALVGHAQAEVAACETLLARSFADEDLNGAAKQTLRLKYLCKMLDDARHHRARLTGAPSLGI